MLPYSCRPSISTQHLATVMHIPMHVANSFDIDLWAMQTCSCRALLPRSCAIIMELSWYHTSQALN